MILDYKPVLPYHYGYEVDKIKEEFKVGDPIKAFTLNDKFEIIECQGVIESDGSWNYHNNYDDSQDTMYCIIDGIQSIRWFTPKKEIIRLVQKENINSWKDMLRKEAKRVSGLL